MTAEATRALFADIFFDDEEATDPSQLRLHHKIRSVARELLRAARAAMITARRDVRSTVTPLLG